MRMFDTTDPASIPQSAGTPDYAAGYIDGNPAWQDASAMHALYPSAVPVSITVFGSLVAQVADCENGDLTPVGAANWAKEKINAGVVPTIYCSDATWPDVQTAVQSVGLTVSQIDWWIAAYPGIGPVLYPGSVAHQWIDHGPYDESIVVDGWVPGRPIAAPAPPPVPNPVPFNPLDLEVLIPMPSDPGATVRLLYRLLLFREVDISGYTANVDWLNAGGSLDQVIANLQDSAEGQAVIAAQRKSIGL